jgi:hypothetical protein
MHQSITFNALEGSGERLLEDDAAQSDAEHRRIFHEQL